MKTVTWGRFRAAVDEITELTEVVRRNADGNQVILGYWLPGGSAQTKRDAYAASFASFAEHVDGELRRLSTIGGDEDA